MLFRYMLRRWDMLTAMLALAVVASYTASLPPVFIRYAVDLGVARGGSLDAVLFYSLASVGVTAASGLLNFVARYVSARYSQEVVHRIRLEAFDAVLRQYMGFFDRLTVGQLISRITNDSERIARETIATSSLKVSTSDKSSLKATVLALLTSTTHH